MTGVADIKEAIMKMVASEHGVILWHRYRNSRGKEGREGREEKV
jgi:hypothetical protein